MELVVTWSLRPTDKTSETRRWLCFRYPGARSSLILLCTVLWVSVCECAYCAGLPPPPLSLPLLCDFFSRNDGTDLIFDTNDYSSSSSSSDATFCWKLLKNCIITLYNPFFVSNDFYFGHPENVQIYGWYWIYTMLDMIKFQKPRSYGSNSNSHLTENLVLSETLMLVENALCFPRGVRVFQVLWSNSRA